MRKLILWPNRNAFYYVFDRETGELLLVKQFARQTWTEGIDSKGRPIVKPGALPSEEGVVVFPGIQGAINWFSTSYSPKTGLLYLPVRDVPTLITTGDVNHNPGDFFLGSRWQGMPDEPSWAVIRAMGSGNRRVAAGQAVCPAKLDRGHRSQGSTHCQTGSPA